MLELRINRALSLFRVGSGRQDIGEFKIHRPLIHIYSDIIPAMLQFYSTCPENRAMLESNPSAGSYLR